VNIQKKSHDPKSDKKTVVLSPTVVVLATYVLLLLSKLVDVTLINRDNEYLSVVILQMMIFLIPAAVWCRFSGDRYMRSLRLRPFRADAILLIAASAVLMISGGVLISMLVGGLDNLSAQNFTLYDTFVSKDDGSVPIKLYLILAYAALPAVCEEFVYRGILCREYERGGVLRAVLLSSLFFGMLHFNLHNLPVYLFAGVILSLTMYATRSVFGAMLAHFLYNLFGLFGQPYVSTFYRLTGSTALFVFVVGFLFLLSATVFCAQAARLYRLYLYKNHSADYRLPLIKKREERRASYVEVLAKPTAIASVAVYVIALVITLF